MASDRASKAPAGTGPAGLRLWKAVAGQFVLDGHHLELLRAAVKVADVVHGLDELVDAEGLVVASPQGVKIHPAVVEARAQRLVLVRLVASLGLPDEETGKVDGRRRGKPRPAYKLHAIGEGA